MAYSAFESMMTEPTAEAVPIEPPSPARGASGPSVSVEALAWAAVLAGGAALRAVSLERPPFGLAEAGRALDAQRAAQGAAAESWVGDLVAALTSHLFSLFGESEALSRVPAAAAGALLVAALWLARPHIGRVGALAAAALVAFSPLSVLFARSAQPFGAGALLAGAMVVSLFAYVRDPRPWSVFLLALSLGLAPLTDSVAVSAALAVLVFLLVEAAFFRGEAVAPAWRDLRRSPLQWITVLLVLAAVLQLGFTHFGTGTEGEALPGLRQWLDMFDYRRDGRPPEYYAALLLAYDWPLLLAGGAGFAILVYRLARRGPGALGPFARFLLLWAALGGLTLALAAQREAGQLLIVLLPLALLAGAFAEELLAVPDWSLLRRWWPLPAACLGLVAYAALVLTEWSSPGGGWNGAPVALAMGGAAALLAASVAVLRRDAVALALPVAAAVAVAFLAHSSLAVAFGEGEEFAADLRLRDERAAQFRSTLDLLVLERGNEIVIDETLREVLAWPLRESGFAFAATFEGASAVVAPADVPPLGFVPLGEPWRLAEGWYPYDLDFLPLWRWLVYRSAYGRLDAVDVRIYVPAP